MALIQVDILALILTAFCNGIGTSMGGFFIYRYFLRHVDEKKPIIIELRVDAR